MQSSLSIESFFRSDIFYIMMDVLVFLLFISYAAKRREGFIFFLTAFFIVSLKLLIFVGLRPFDAGNDTIHYYYTFQSLGDISGARDIGIQDYGNSELLYWPFAALFKVLISSDFQVYLIFSIFISAYLVYMCNKLAVEYIGENARWHQASLALIFTYAVFLSFEIAYFGGHIRSAFGVPLAFISYMFALNRKFWLTLLFFSLSLCFHNSAISVAPLLIVEFLKINFSYSKKMTVSVVTAFLVAFLIGKFEGLQSIIQLAGGFYSQRYTDYYEYKNFNITSVFTTGYFLIIILHVVIFLAIGYARIHFYFFYYFFLILLFSATPKISERYFAYILICLPFLLYSSLKNRFCESKSLIITIVVCFMAGLLTITSYGAVSTLSIHSFLFPDRIGQ
ncbi:EpsG family protein [Pectobacterium aquaticum]|uniref:EpsG family protein n=1 Tax=Pectobacterium aquaticum TaxID=2204145 RepID=UPI000E269E38|nr:EpsG family protein [Pectobacterium aquaticum]UEM38254.1 EpsG family protein [Pectobacterium aquaticum]